MSSKVHYQKVPLQGPLVKALHAHAKRTLPRGSVIVDISTMRALGGGDVEAGERILHAMFQMSAPGAISPAAVREAGLGSYVKGRRVIEAFLNQAHEQHENAKAAHDSDGPEAERNHGNRST
ncbi:MAG: hypothetical protein WAL15_06470 [Xanthobacteraceae bacterium]|jgi:hypothetical protein